MKLVFLFLVLVFLKCVWLDKAYKILPPQELRRRAREHDAAASRLNKVAGKYQTLTALIWLFGLASATALFIMSARYAWWATVLVIMVMSWLLFWSPKPKVGGWTWRFCALTAPFVYKFLGWVEPVILPLSKLWPKRAEVHIHSGLYEKEDLLDLLNNQNHLADNRIPEGDLKAAFGALTFGDKTVGKTMTPLRKIRFVAENEQVGPLLMDELHATGFSRFPVTSTSVKEKGQQPKVTGTLYLKELIEHPDKPKVKDLMRKDAYFINETCTLHQALDAFLLTHHHLLVVVNKFEEIVGVLSMEDVLEQIIGTPIVDEFDKYDDLRAAAAHDANAERTKHEEVKPTTESKSVVE